MHRSPPWLLGTLVLFLCTPESTGATGFDSEAQLDEWMTYYYLHPEPDQVLAAVHSYAASASYEEWRTTLAMATFFAAVLRQDPRLLHQTYEGIAQRGAAASKNFFLQVLWAVDTAASRGLLEHASVDWPPAPGWCLPPRRGASIPAHAVEAPLDHPADLDRLWALFMATGDAAPVRKIISVLPLTEIGHGAEGVLGGAAQWSLTRNARDHQRVYTICQRELQRSEGTTRTLLENTSSPRQLKQRQTTGRR
jgi:hypothetical protein